MAGRRRSDPDLVLAAMVATIAAPIAVYVGIEELPWRSADKRRHPDRASRQYPSSHRGRGAEDRCRSLNSRFSSNGAATDRRTFRGREAGLLEIDQVRKRRTRDVSRVDQSLRRRGARAEALPELSRRGGSRRPIRLCPKADAERELEAAERVGAVPVFTIEPDYPALLARIEAPPPMLYIKGRRELSIAPAVAIVGSRQCSAAGVQLTRRFANELAEAGFVIVSGLARGIDRAAHDTALNRGTVAVLAGGIDWIYPPEHAELQQRIGIEGCLVTERPPGFQPRDKDFPRRNRIIAGLVHGVVIIEAATRSGTLVTARYANDLGREVFALPGHPLDPRAEGTNRLIKSGATFVTAPEDVVEVLRPIMGSKSPAPTTLCRWIGGRTKRAVSEAVGQHRAPGGDQMNVC